MRKHAERPRDKMLHIFVGTKAQLIKMAPIMRELDRRCVPYRFIDAGQHAATTAPMITQFDLRSPDIALRAGRGNISSLAQGATWLVKLMWQGLVRPEHVRRTVFEGRGGLCLIHGDTATTLGSLLLAKRAGLAVAHVEAGLRSFNLLDPFPEEIIRLIAMRFSDLLFAPNEWAFANLQAMNVRGTVALSGGNTVVDAVDYAREHCAGDSSTSHGDEYAVMSIHRFETIRSRRRLAKVVTLAHAIASQHRLKFILHEPTQHYLEQFGLMTSLEVAECVEMLPLQPYLSFIAMLSRAIFVVSDGGSIQEETHALGVPCLVLRKRTERLDGLGETALLAGFDEARIQSFLCNYEEYRREPLYKSNAESPASRIVDSVLGWLSVQSEMGV